MGRLAWHTLGRQRQDFLDSLFVELARRPAARQVTQSFMARFLIALAPFEDHWRRDLQPFADLLGRQATVQQQQNSGPPADALR